MDYFHKRTDVYYYYYCVGLHVPTILNVYSITKNSPETFDFS